MVTCPFCTLPAERIIHTSQHGLIIRDGYPISPGHSLVIPRRHVDSFFNLSADEKLDLLGLLEIADLIMKLTIEHDKGLTAITNNSKIS
jgi:diadenosine tetraphosphate (Ap4A) HIT family hydrolase